MGTTYKFDITQTSRYEIEDEIVSGALANSSVEEQLAMRGGDKEAVAEDIASFYAENDVEFRDADGFQLSVVSYALSYIERNS